MEWDARPVISLLSSYIEKLVGNIAAKQNGRHIADDIFKCIWKKFLCFIFFK